MVKTFAKVAEYWLPSRQRALEAQRSCVRATSTSGRAR